MGQLIWETIASNDCVKHMETQTISMQCMQQMGPLLNLAVTFKRVIRWQPVNFESIITTEWIMKMIAIDIFMT